MRVLTGKLLTGTLLEIGVALCLLAARPALAADGARTRLAQNVPPAAEQPAPGAVVPSPTTPGGTAGQDQSVQPGVAPPATPQPTAEIPKPFHGSVSFEAGSGKMLTLVTPAANIYVADPKVAEVRPASSTSLFVFGVGPGHTTIAAVDQFGRLLVDYDVTVRPSAYGSREAQSVIARLIPGSRVQVKPSGKGMMLTGAVATAADAAQAMMIAKGFSTGEVDNEMTIAAPTQVTLMVRIAEMKRSTARNIGINWNGVLSLGNLGAAQGGLPILTTVLNNAACATGSATATTLPASFRGPCFSNILNALANEGLAHILAEPNLTVMSGQAASFQAGGEYPYAVPGGSANPNSVTIDFKPYGVLLSFVPTVLSDGRINLHVKPEVSQLDSTTRYSCRAAAQLTGCWCGARKPPWSWVPAKPLRSQGCCKPSPTTTIPDCPVWAIPQSSVPCSSRTA